MRPHSPPRETGMSDRMSEPPRYRIEGEDGPEEQVLQLEIETREIVPAHPLPESRKIGNPMLQAETDHGSGE